MSINQVSRLSPRTRRDDDIALVCLSDIPSCDIHRHMPHPTISDKLRRQTGNGDTAYGDNDAPRFACRMAGRRTGRVISERLYDGATKRRQADEMTGWRRDGRIKRTVRRERREERHERDGTIKRMIVSTIGCSIINAIIFAPSARQGGTGRRMDERRARINGAGNGKASSHSIRLPRKGFRMTDMYISCILAHLPAASYAIVVYSIR